MTPRFGLPGATGVGDVLGVRDLRFSAQQHNWRFGRTQQTFFQRRRLRKRPSTLSSVGNISANGFSSRCLRSRKSRTAFSLRASAMQMKSANAFDRDNFPTADRLRGRRAALRGRQKRLAGRAPKFQTRAANRTRVRLRVKAAVPRIVVFRLARGTHREIFHRGVRAVVRQRFDDAEARAAIRAVGERITESAGSPDQKFPAGNPDRWRCPAGPARFCRRRFRWRGFQNFDSRQRRARTIPGFG